MARSAKKLDRILRVRSLQLDLTRADEVQAADKLRAEADLKARILQLADSVAPARSPALASATSLMAAAHYRDRLHQSVVAADQRIATANRGLDFARERTVEAKRDQSAIEKLIARAEADAALAAVRALENSTSPLRSKNRHGPC